jgi:hypothetical protein
VVTLEWIAALHTVLHGEKRQSRRMQWFQPV